MYAYDPRGNFSLLAIRGQEPDAGAVGIGNYASLGIGSKAEVAFLVQEDLQGRGISTLLLERLAGIAAGHGFFGLEADVLCENQARINVVQDSGFEVHQALDSGSIHVAFPVSGPASLRERVELRDRIASANPLVPLLQPKTVAVAGASRGPSSVGGMILRSILK
jgi:acetate---CoA ligase (ADP-forming)